MRNAAIIVVLGLVFVAGCGTNAAGGVSLFGTHLHARYAPANLESEYVGHHAAQIIELAAAVRGSRKPVVAVGDFNMTEDA